MPSKNNTTDFESILSKDGELIFTSCGFSMYPLIRQKEDILHIVKPSRPYKKQDVVLYKDREHHYVLHRILKIKKNNTVILAGDNNSFLDYPIQMDCILGLLKDITKKDGKTINMEKDNRFSGFLYVHFFYVKALFMKTFRFIRRIGKR